MENIRQNKKAKKNNTAKILFFVFVVSLILFTTGYAILNESLNITGKTNIVPEQLTHGANFEIVDHWYSDFRDYYNIKIKVNNDQAVETTGWKISFDIPSDVNSIDCWEASVEISNNRVTFENLSHNAIIQPDMNTEFGIIFSTALNSEYEPTNIVTKLFLYEEPEEPDIPPIESGIDVQLVLKNNWGDSAQGYYMQYDIVVTNNTGASISSWNFELGDVSKFNLTNIWGCNNSLTSSALVISDSGYNGTIANGESVSFGMQITSSILKYKPYVQYSGITPNNSEEDKDSIPVDDTDEQEENNQDLTAISTVFTAGSSWQENDKYVTQYDVNVTNNTGDVINSWNLEFEDTANFALKSIWNAEYVLTDTKLVISNTGSNIGLASGATATFGCQISSATQGYVPTVSYSGSSK